MKYKLKRVGRIKREKGEGVKIVEVDETSPFKRLGVGKNFVLLKLNGKKVRDSLDFYYYFREEDVNLFEFLSPDGEGIKILSFLEEGESCGFSFDPIKPKICKNDCIFCFVSQHPRGVKVRKTLLIKDDDYRLSFLDGNFITLSNFSGEDVKRVCHQKLWPLYISVHSMNRDLRNFMVRPKKGSSDFFEVFNKLCECGVKFHTQIVLCPGINDGKELDFTIRELFRKRKNVLSVGIVPVGLTDYRDGLFKLKPITPEYSKMVISQVERYHNFFKDKVGRGFVYLADEFYLNAGVSIPMEEYYDDFSQIENGIGMVRKFLDEFDEIFFRKKVKPHNKNFSIITGESFFGILKDKISELNNVHNLNIKVFCAKNFFFGKNVTVAGLLSGVDIERVILENEDEMGDFLCIPGESLMAEEDKFLDNILLKEIERKFKKKIYPLRYGPLALKEVIENKNF